MHCKKTTPNLHLQPIILFLARRTNYTMSSPCGMSSRCDATKDIKTSGTCNIPTDLHRMPHLGQDCVSHMLRSELGFVVHYLHPDQGVQATVVHQAYH